MTALKGPIWLVFIIGWIIAILVALIDDRPALAFGLGILAVSNWWVLGFLFAWYFGIRRHARKHLKCRPTLAVEVSYPPNIQERIDLVRALTELNTNSKSRDPVGIGQVFRNGLLENIQHNIQTSSIKFKSYEVGPGEWDELPVNAVYFLEINGSPFIASLLTFSQFAEDYDEETVRSHHGSQNTTALQIVAQKHETCRAARALLLSSARAVSSLKGQTIVVRQGLKANSPQIELTTIAPVDVSQIVLPEAIFEAVDRTVLQQMQLAERLKASGQRTRTAILLFGPPGTGKTLLTRYLIHKSPGFTTIQLQGFQRSLVRECFRLARYLEPSLVILEDVDLIAVRRQRNQRGTSALHALLDELDGLAPESRCAVMMTTNRPDVLEPALASRPGRVTQAIEFPMPNLEERQQLLTLFLSRVQANTLNLADWARKTDGASPAFIEELIRRGVLIAIQRQPAASLTHVIEEDLHTAMHEIISLGGSLTSQLLGHRT